MDTVVKSCQELELCFLTRVSEGTLGLVDYHCRAPFRPSVPWCFSVREVRFFKAICWLKDVASSCSSRSRSSAAATTKVAAEQLTAGAGQQEGHVDKLPRAAKSWEFVFLTRVSEGTLGLVSSSRDKQVASEQPQQWKQREQLAAS